MKNENENDLGTYFINSFCHAFILFVKYILATCTTNCCVLDTLLEMFGVHNDSNGQGVCKGDLGTQHVGGGGIKLCIKHRKKY